jgi:hypothetical protein
MTIEFSIVLEGSKSDKLTKTRQEYKVHSKLETTKPSPYNGQII